MKFSVENGCFSYKKGGRPVLNGISFSAEAGDLIAILGPNGSGKTTLLRCCLGFLRWTEGRSTIDGADITSIPGRELWKRMAYVPQARGIASGCTVEELVLLGRSSSLGVFAQPKAEDIRKVGEVMERLSITGLRDKRCDEISGGELQMALIARALAAEPKMLVLDEPESNLDFRNQLIIMETVSSLSKEGMICVFNTHYPAHAMQRANKSLLLSADAGYKFGNTDSVVTEENVEAAFGVKTVITQLEMQGNQYKNITPIMLSERTKQ